MNNEIKISLNNVTYYINFANRVFYTFPMMKADMIGQKIKYDGTLIPSNLTPTFNYLIVSKNFVQTSNGEVFKLPDNATIFMMFLRHVDVLEYKLELAISRYRKDYQERFLNNLQHIEKIADDGKFLTPSQISEITKLI